jgi:hypothetical protein
VGSGELNSIANADALLSGGFLLPFCLLYVGKHTASYKRFDFRGFLRVIAAAIHVTAGGL